MNYTLTVLTFLLFFVSLKINDDDFASPSVLFSLCFFVSSVLLTVNTLIWNYVIGPNTVCIIVSGILVFILGCQSRKRFRLIVSRNKNGDAINQENRYGENNITFSIPLTVTLLFIVIGLSAIFIRLMSIRSVTGDINIFSNTILRTYRNAETVPYGTLMKFFSPLTEAIALMYLITIIDALVYRKRVGLINFIPVVIYAVYSALSSARIEIIYLFIIILVTYVFISRSRLKRKLSFKQFALITLAIIAVVFLFFGLGFLTGKSQSQISISDNIAMYAASSIPAFDNYLKTFTYDIQNLGTNTFYGISNILSYFGIGTNIVSRNGDFVMLGSMRHMTNIYTCFRPLLNDYNYLGMYIVLFIEGRIFQSIYIKANSSFTKEGKPLWLMFYAYSAGYLALSSIAERVFSSWITLTTGVFIFFLFVFNRFFLIREIR